MKKRVIKKIPKHSFGAVLGTGLPLISSLIGSAKLQKQQQEATNRAKELAEAQNLAQSNLALDGFKTEGDGYVDYYAAKGGKIARSPYVTKGGDLEPLSNDTVIAKGNTHEESKIDNTSGIKLANNQGTIAEIEDQETIKDGDKVYSDRLSPDGKNSYADLSKKLATKKGKIEDDVKNNTKIKNQTNQRKLASLTKKEDTLFLHQEASKQKNTNTVEMEEGGSLLTKAVPYLDNVVNFGLTLNTPEVDKPLMENITPLKTKVNVNPQMNAVTQAVESSSKAIKDNSSNSASARNGITKARLQGASQKANILANKENVESSLYNQNVQNAQRITARNLAKTSEYQDKNLARAGDIQSRISKNVSNAVGDYIDNENKENAEDYNAERLDIARNSYEGGVTRRSILNNPTDITKAKTDPSYAEKLLNMFKGTKEEARFRELLGLNEKAYAVNKLSSNGLNLNNSLKYN